MIAKRVSIENFDVLSMVYLTGYRLQITCIALPDTVRDTRSNTRFSRMFLINKSATGALFCPPHYTYTYRVTMSQLCAKYLKYRIVSM